MIEIVRSTKRIGNYLLFLEQEICRPILENGMPTHYVRQHGYLTSTIIGAILQIERLFPTSTGLNQNKLLLTSTQSKPAKQSK